MRRVVPTLRAALVAMRTSAHAQIGDPAEHAA